jgi:hypothetical protein
MPNEASARPDVGAAQDGNLALVEGLVVTIAATRHIEKAERPRQPDGPVPMQRMFRAEAQRRSSGAAAQDFLSASVPWLMVGVTMLPFVVLSVWLIAMYFGVEYGTPPWNTHSVPPPRL